MQQPAPSGITGREEKAALFAFWFRRICSAFPSKYSMAAAFLISGRRASVKRIAMGSSLKKTLTAQMTFGFGISFRVSSVRTPRVPSEPTIRSIASISSAA